MIKNGKLPEMSHREFLCREVQCDAAGMPPYPLVSVNILSFNRCKELRRTLEAITRELKYPSDLLEIIVVDNASRDGSADMVAREFPGVQLVRRSVNCGVSAWNDGFRHCHGEYILVLDDDCYLTGEDLNRALSAAQEMGAALVSFSVANPNEPGFYFNRDVNPGVLSFWGCAALIRSDVIARLGGFEPAIFVYTHELEFTIRLLDAGFSHLFLPEVRAMHNKPAGESKAFSARAPFLWASNRGVILGKLMPLPYLVLLFCRTMLGYLRYGFRTPMRTLKVSWHFCLGLSRGWQRRDPVSHGTASFYCKNYMEFAPPVLCWGESRQQREATMKEARSRYYPDESACLLESMEDSTMHC
jgi:GT2 family glycosyltransferase